MVLTYTLQCGACKRVTAHRREGHFLADGNAGEAKLVYACVVCGRCRVWGSAELSRVALSERSALLGPQVDYLVGRRQ
jgi:hypothetical protein